MNIYIKESVFKDIIHITKNKSEQKVTIDRVINLIKSKKYEKLKGKLKEYYRVGYGEYRAIFCPYKDGFLILRIAKRQDIYKHR